MVQPLQPAETGDAMKGARHHLTRALTPWFPRDESSVTVSEGDGTPKTDDEYDQPCDDRQMRRCT